MAVEYNRLLHAAAYWPMWPFPSKKHEWKDQWDWGHRILKWGPPGGGKTSADRDFAARNGMHFLVIDSTVGEGALGAVPTPDMNKSVLRFMPADFMVEAFPNNEPGTLLCDDATTFPPSLQGSLLGLFLDKRIGFNFLSPRTRVVMAANEAIDAPGGWDLAPSVANRPCHIQWPDPTVDEWCSWLLTGGRRKVEQTVKPLVEEKRVLKIRAACMQQAASEMAGFSMAQRHMHRVQPSANDPQASKAWVSPRTKYFATLALASSYAHDLNAETTDVFVGGYVGNTFAEKFSTWRSEQDLPNAREFLEGFETFEHDQYRIDRTAAMVASCLALLGAAEGKDQRRLVGSFYSFLDTVADDALDTVADVIIDSMHAMSLVRGIPEAKTILKRLRPVLEATQGV